MVNSVKRALTRTHTKLPVVAGCGSCAWECSAPNPTPELTVEVYRAAKQHARDHAGHRTSVTAGTTHHYVQPAEATTS